MSTSSVCDQLINRMVTVLTGATEAADRVFDSREAAIARDEMPCIAITPPDSEESRVFGGGVDQNTVLITVSVLARNDAWRAVADRVVVAAHRLLMGDAQLQALVVKITKEGRKWEAEEADQTAGSDSITYRLIYLSLSNDLTSTF
jgi:hypothetical protein